MRMMLFVVNIVLLNFALIHHATASEQSWEHKDWSVSSQDNFVRYITHGDVVHGHQFGFIKMEGNCDQDLLWINWSTNRQGLQEFKGKDATFQFRVDNTTFQIEVPLIDVYQDSSILTIAGFTNFAAGDKLISLLEEGHKIEVTISYPETLVNKFDVVTDSFSLNGFIAARLKSKELCDEAVAFHGPQRAITQSGPDLSVPVPDDFVVSNADIVQLLTNFKAAVKNKDAERVVSMLEQKPDYYYFGPNKEDILADFNKAIPPAIQKLLLGLDINDASIDWYYFGVAFYYPSGGLLLSFYPSCDQITKTCAMDIGNLRTPDVISASEKHEKRQWDAAAQRTALVNLNNMDDVNRFLQGQWRISDFEACGIHSGGAEADADAVIGDWVNVEGTNITIPVSSHGDKEIVNGNTTYTRYAAGRQTCSVTSTKHITLSDQCRHDLGYILNPIALQIDYACEEPEDLHDGDYSMDDRSLLLADDGNIVLLSVWEIYVSLARKGLTE